MVLRFLRSLSLLGIGIGVTGCSSFTIVQPQNGTTVNPPVNANVTWNDSNMTSIRFTVDGTDKTSAFAINYTSTGGQATATLPLGAGQHTLAADGDYYFIYSQHATSTSSFTVNGPSITLSTTPNPFNLAPGNSGTLTINVSRGGGFSGPVTVTFSAPPAGVTLTPASLNVAGASATTTISAAPTTAIGQTTLTVSGSSGGVTATPQSLSLNIAWPTPAISSVSPNLAPKGGAVTITGTNFSASCANNAINLAGVTGITPTGACTATTLHFSVPPGANYGATQLTVASHSVASNPVAFTVARAPGLFVEITNSIEGQSANQTCSTGAVQLTICTGVNCAVPTAPFTATYSHTGGGQIGQPLGFHKNNSRVAGLGGAGFSLCTVGAVLDGDTSGSSPQLMGIQFLDLASGHLFPSGGIYNFNYVTPSQQASYTPRIFRSPDGTIIIVATASTIGPTELTAGVVDQATSGNVNTNCQSPSVNSNFSASITSGNQVSISLAGTTCTPITIR